MAVSDFLSKVRDTSEEAVKLYITIIENALINIVSKEGVSDTIIDDKYIDEAIKKIDPDNKHNNSPEWNLMTKQTVAKYFKRQGFKCDFVFIFTIPRESELLNAVLVGMPTDDYDHSEYDIHFDESIKKLEWTLGIYNPVTMKMNYTNKDTKWAYEAAYKFAKGELRYKEGIDYTGQYALRISW